jgi:hypothetical protein
MIASDDSPVPDDDLPLPEEALPPDRDPWNRADYQRIWLGAQSRTWRTLAIVPVDDWVSAYEVAKLISALGVHHGISVGAADLGSLGLTGADDILEGARFVCRQDRLVFATSTITQNLAAVALARAADCVVLCVSLGSTSLRLVEETIQQIGKERFLGSIVVRAAEPDVRARSAMSVRSLLRAEP